MPPEEREARFQRLAELVRDQPEVVTSAFFALFHAALELPPLPLVVGQESEVRRQMEKKVYADINEMPPPPTTQLPGSG